MKYKLSNIRIITVAASGLGLGIIAAKVFSLIWILSLVCLLISCYFIFIAKKVRPLLLFLICFSIGALRLLLDYPILPNSDNYIIKGRICSIVSIEDNYCKAELDNVVIDNKRIDKNILLSFSKAYSFLEYGDTVTAYAHVSVPNNTKQKYYYLSNGIACTASGNIQSVSKGKSDIFGFFICIRKALCNAVDECFSSNSALVKALILGSKNDMLYQDINAFRISGASHILALSGLHISFFVSTLRLFLKNTGYKLRSIIIIFFLALYCCITAFPASLIRASLLYVCSLAAVPLKRKYDGLAALSLAFILILMFDPFQLFSMGFQFSFLAVLGINYLQKKLLKVLSFLYDPFRDSLSVCLSGTLSTLPFNVYHFNNLQTNAIITNIIALPLMSIAMAPALISLIVYIVFPAIGKMLAAVPDFILGIMLSNIKAFSSLPYAIIELKTPSIISICIYYFALFICSKYCLLKKMQKILLLIGLIILFIFSLL